MSTTIDQRVLEMRFDNKQFEQNVSSTMSLLDKFKQRLNLTGAAKGLEDVGSAARKIDLSGLVAGAEAVRVKFSYLQASIQHQLNQMVDGAVAAGKRIASALTIDPIKTGFSEYETQINAVQTILANTKSKGTDINDVNKALDELNTYADKTIYNFTEMTRNIGTFTAAGVDLDKSVTSIKGIANLAAVSGSSSQQASTAMYQLSQALAAGKVSLMDWNSVVNAGMGGEVFQNALKRTAENMGTNVDALIKKYGSFRESLTQGEWLTADVLTETLTQLSGAYTEADLIAKGYTKEQAAEILDLANTAEEAATKVKTFTQLWDTLKEAAQSGWTQTWEILIGDFEEAKEMLSKVSDVIGKMIGDSAEARNNLLQGWKDAGGRDDMIKGFVNIFDALMRVIRPVAAAFKEIFPPVTVEQLLKFSEGFKNFTENLKLSSPNIAKLKITFKGIFSVLDIGWTVIKQLAGGVVELLGHFTGLGGGVLDITSAIGGWLLNLRNSVKETDIFGTAIDKIVGFLGSAIDMVKNFGTAVSDSFKSASFDKLGNFFLGLWNVIKAIGSKVADIFAPLAQGIADVFENSTFMDVLNGGLLAGIFAGIFKFGDKLASPFEALADVFEGITGEGGIFEGITGILDEVRGCFEAYQNQLNAGTLQKIAIAIGILAASILVISSIDPGRLDHSLGAIGILFAELIGSLAIFSKMSLGMKGVAKAVPLMIAMSTAILILSAALKNVSSLEWGEIGKGLVTVGALMAELAAFLAVAKFSGKVTGTAIGIVILSSAMLILAKAVERFGGMDWSQIGKGLASIGGLLAEIAIFSRLTSNAKHMVSTGVSMVLFGASMKIFASAMSDFAAMRWEEIGRSLAAMGGALAELTLAMRLMPKGAVAQGVGLIAVGAALKILASALGDFGGMSWTEIGIGLAAMGGALAELAIALNLMNGTLAGSAALVIAVSALAILAPVMKSLGGMSWEAIAKGLVTIAGAFAIVGIAAALLTPIIPTLAALAGAMALFGLSVLGIGVGVLALSAGVTALSAAGTALVAAVAAILVGIADLIPEIADALGKGILALCTVIEECAPAIVETLMIVIAEALVALAEYTPTIVNALFDFAIALIDGFAERMPELIASAVNLIGQFFKGIVDALSGIDTTNLLKGIAGIGLMTALMYALSGVAALIPGAMTGVLGMGVVIAELALVLAAIGALAQIPGLSWLIEEGGDFLQKIGTAIGQFIGGIVGGIAQGATASLPQIGTDLSNFMKNMEGFITGAQGLDATSFDGVKAMASAILTLTAANILDAISSWISGKSTLSSFAEDLVPFGKAMKEYAAEVAGLNSEAISNSATAAKAMVEVAEAIPSDGVFGTDGIDDFGKNLVKFGKCLKDYAAEVVDVNSDAIVKSVSAAQGIVDVAKNIPDDGAFGTDGIDNFGDNMVSFAKSLKKYADKVADISVSAITNSTSAVRSLMSMINSMAGIDTSGVDSFKDAISSLSKTDISGFVDTFKSLSKNMVGMGADLVDSLAKGITSKKASLTVAGTTLVTKMSTAMSQQKILFYTIGIETASRFISGISSQAARTSRAGASLSKSAATGATGSYNSFYTAGAYLAAGFANGISANSYKAAARARAMAAAAARAAKEELDEHSPSRVGYQIGDFFGVAFVNAIGDYVKRAYKASSELAVSAKSGLSESLARIQDGIDSNLDMQPTIRPILDLSDIQYGARAMEGLLGIGSSSGVLATVGAISSGMNRKGQNGGVADVVSAIDKLRKDLGNVGNTTNIINGVTYDDGSNINAAVRTIAQAILQEGRV